MQRWRRTTAPGGPQAPVQYIRGLDGSLLAEADAATGRTLREYIWLPQDDASPAADNDNEEGAEPPPLPLALVTGVNTTAPKLLMVHADHLSRPVRLTDANRTTVWTAIYDPFGQPVSVDGTVEQNLRFPGQYFLIESGLSYNWHRFYDPATGRYTQPDPLRFVDGPSVYVYVGASPMMRVDPEGLAPRDQWYGYNDTNFRWWVHRCWKFEGDRDLTKEELDVAYAEWTREGKPIHKCYGDSNDSPDSSPPVEDTPNEECGSDCQETANFVIIGGILHVIYSCIRLMPPQLPVLP